MIELRRQQQGGHDALIDLWVRKGLKENPVIVLPTGGGKAYLIAAVCKTLIKRFPAARIGVCIHSKELVEQNHQAIKEYWPGAPVGMYSASVGRKDKDAQILVAGIQSLAGNLSKTGGFDFILVDEAQRVDFIEKEDTQYQKLFRENMELAPNFRVAGITATPWRASKPIFGWWEAIFDSIIFEVSILEMIEDGHLVPPKTVQQDVRINTDGVKVSATTGDFVEKALAAAANTDDVNIPAVAETSRHLSEGRKAALVFCTSIDHGERVTELFNASGHRAKMVHGKMKKAEREKVIRAYKAGKFQILVNCQVLLVGFDHKPIDLITVLRPTKSSALWLQLLGRGMRVAPGTDKVDCLVLDFTDTSDEMGPIDLIRPPAAPKRKVKKEDEVIDASGIKECPSCGDLLVVGTKLCECGHEFGSGPVGMEKLKETASAAALLSTQAANSGWSEVTRVWAAPHVSWGKPDMLKVIFYRGDREVCTKFLCFNHTNYAREQAMWWWKVLTQSPYEPHSTDDAYMRRADIRTPSAIKVKKNGQYMDLLDVRFRAVEGVSA